MNYRKSYWLMWAALAAGLLVMYLFVWTGHMAFAYLGVLAMLAGVGQTFRFCRCPHCGAMLHLRGGVPKRCGACGKDLPGVKQKK